MTAKKIISCWHIAQSSVFLLGMASIVMLHVLLNRPRLPGELNASNTAPCSQLTLAWLPKTLRLVWDFPGKNSHLPSRATLRCRSSHRPCSLYRATVISNVSRLCIALPLAASASTFLPLSWPDSSKERRSTVRGSCLSSWWQHLTGTSISSWNHQRYVKSTLFLLKDSEMHHNKQCLVLLCYRGSAPSTSWPCVFPLRCLWKESTASLPLKTTSLTRSNTSWPRFMEVKRVWRSIYLPSHDVGF